MRAARHSVAVMLAICLNGAAVADWRPLLSTDDAQWYVDDALTRKRGTMAKVWTLQDLNTPRPLYSGQYQSVKLQAEIRCHSNQWRELYSSYYTGRMGDGEMIYVQQTAGAWKQVVPGAYSAAAFKSGCHPEKPEN